MSLHAGNATSLIDILNRTPTIPDNCQWCNFLRNHDELTLEMVTEEERHYLWNEYAPEARMRLNLGIRRRLAPLLDDESAQDRSGEFAVVHLAGLADPLLRR